MDTHNQPHGNLQPEDSGVQVKPLAMFMIILTVATALAFVAVKLMEGWLEKTEAERDAQRPATRVVATGAEQKLPPEPRLQGAPKPGDKTGERTSSDLPLDDLIKYRKQQEEKAGSFGWVDKNASVGHISIERAKELFVEREQRGEIPKLKSATAAAEIEAAEVTRRQVLGADASAGRIIKK